MIHPLTEIGARYIAPECFVAVNRNDEFEGIPSRFELFHWRTLDGGSVLPAFSFPEWCRDFVKTYYAGESPTLPTAFPEKGEPFRERSPQHSVSTKGLGPCASQPEGPFYSKTALGGRGEAKRPTLHPGQTHSLFVLRAARTPAGAHWPECCGVFLCFLAFWNDS